LDGPFTNPDIGAITDDLRQLVVKAANLGHVKPAEIDPDLPLYRDGLGLDSIDILELVVHVERRYGLKIRNDDAGRVALRTIRSLAEVTQRHLQGATRAER
jgi:acyl carrier protein